MNRLKLLSATFFAAGLLWFATAAAHTATTYSDTISALRTAAGEGEGVALVIDAAGDLPGMGKVVLKREGGNVTGGTWTLTVLPPNANATSSERGTLSGSVTGGTLSFDGSGVPTGASDVRLSVEGGTGEQAGVSGGSGTINLSPDPENPSRLKGTLVLSF